MNEELGRVPPHIASEFYLWLWYTSETTGGTMALGGEHGEVTFWVDDRLAFRGSGEEKVTAVLTGEAPSTTLEARAALRGGKVLRDLKLALRREDREYAVTLRGPGIDLAGAKLPALVKGGDVAESVYERMFLYEELHWMIGALFRRFAEERAGAGWEESLVPALRRWVAGQPGGQEA